MSKAKVSELLLEALNRCLPLTAEDDKGCEGCPYFENVRASCVTVMSRDALELLKEQEPVKQKVSEWLEDSDPGQEYGTTWACRKCMHSIHKPYIWNPYDSGYKYCPHCGAMMEVSGDA